METGESRKTGGAHRGEAELLSRGIDNLVNGQECWVREAVFLCRTEDTTVWFYFWNNTAGKWGKVTEERG